MINIIGYFAGEFGLGTAARNIARLVARRGAAPACSLLLGGLGRDRAAPPFPTPEPGILNLQYPTTLVISGAVVGSKPTEDLVEFARGKTRLAMLAYWELTQLQADSRRYLELADTVFAGSPFSLDVLRRELPHKPCAELPCPLEPIDVPEASRRRFGLPEDVPLALASFEPASDLTRKNPDGAIRAFLRFSERHGGMLVLKVNWPAEVDRNEALACFRQARALIETARRNPRIIVIDSSMPEQELYALYACVDAVISLHRAEGLGLLMLEAMALGIPVIATAYSGNLAFMDASHPGLVPYRLVTASAPGSIYDRANYDMAPQWAEPDLEHAARVIARALTDRGFADDLRHAGRGMYAAYQARARSADWLARLLAPAPRYGHAYADVQYSYWT